MARSENQPEAWLRPNLTEQDTDCLLATVEWALNHEWYGPNETTLDEFTRQIGGRVAVERAARKIESVADLKRRGVDTDFSVLGNVPRPSRRQRICELFRARRRDA